MKSIDSTLQKGKYIMKSKLEKIFDRTLDYAGMALVMIGLAVVIAVVAIVIIVNVLKALAFIAIGLCIAGATIMILWGMLEHVKETIKDKKN